MARIESDQNSVVESIVERLIAKIDEFSEDNCFVSDAQSPLDSNIRQDLICTVCPLDGDFDQEAFDGGGQFTVYENAAVVVSVFTTAVQLDSVGRIVEMLTNRSFGLLELKRKILKSLTMFEPHVGGDAILVQPMRPLRSEKPSSDGKKIGAFAITFETIIHWELTP